MAISDKDFKNLIIAMKEVGEIEGKSKLVSPVADKIIAEFESKEKFIPYEEYIKVKEEQPQATPVLPQFTPSSSLSPIKTIIKEDVEDKSLKIIPPKKELRDYLTTREINFIKSNQNLLNNQDWIQFVQELNDAFLYKENMYAIVDFLKATLPHIDFTELESLIDALE